MSPKTRVILFLALTIGLSALSYIPILVSGSLYGTGGLFMLTLMWSPGLAAIVTQLIATRSLRGLGWKPGQFRWLGLAYILPVLYGLPVYAFVWLTRLGGLPNPELVDRLAEMAPNLAAPLRMAAFLLVSATVVVLVSLLTALGEEIGWRGLFVPELAKMTGFTKAALISGAVWAAWHMPALLFTDYSAGGVPGWYATACFTLMVVTASFAYAWLRLKSGSLWPAALLHASHNLFILNVFDDLTIITSVTPFIISETGIGLVITGLISAYLFWRRRGDLPQPDSAPQEQRIPSPTLP